MDSLGHHVFIKVITSLSGEWTGKLSLFAVLNISKVIYIGYNLAMAPFLMYVWYCSFVVKLPRFGSGRDCVREACLLELR